MLSQVLREIEQAPGSLNINDLSIKLGIDRSALEGMIQFWVQKGRLRDDDADALAASTSATCASGSCGDSCPGAAGCPFIAKMPKTYSVAKVYFEEDE